MGIFDDDNLGILGGIAQGIKGGIEGYQNTADRQYKRRAQDADLEDRKQRRLQASAQLAAKQIESERKMDSDDIRAYSNSGVQVQRDPSTGRVIRDDASGLIKATQDPSFQLVPRGKTAQEQQLVDEQIKALGQKPVIGERDLIANKMTQGYEPIKDEKGQVVRDANGQISNWKMSDWKQKQVDADLALKGSQTKKNSRPAGAGGSGKEDDKLGKSMTDALDPNKARGGNLAKSQAMINSADRVDGLFKQFPDYNIPKGQTIELTSAIAGLINGGSAQSQHQIDSMTPSSLRGNAEGIAGWLSNNPRGLQQQNYMKMMHETAIREREIALNQVKNAQIQRLSAHSYLKGKNPGLYNSILQSFDIDPSQIDAKGRYAPGGGMIKEGLVGQGAKGLINGQPGQTAAPPAPHPEDNAAVTWAKQNLKNPANAQKAAEILKANGVK